MENSTKILNFAKFWKCVRELVDGAFEGYNTSVFAYGQTGSGKTFTMGTSLEGDPAKRGIIPNAAQQIFDEIEGRREQARRSGKVIPSLEVSAQFIELYNEELIDLLSPDRGSSSIKIMENPTSHEILLMGASSRIVKSQEDIMSALVIGAQNQTTAQLQRKYAALETRVREYETELENGREQMERAKRYIVDQENRPEKDARRTLLKLAEMFESPIPTTSNVARLRKQFDDDDNDADDN